MISEILAQNGEDNAGKERKEKKEVEKNGDTFATVTWGCIILVLNMINELILAVFC